ncbi:MAG: class IV adenylate cyclase [Candidatus Aenigmarchaeota archaeon]|nr:class IV adenylate cyclase [Candidatus Aenigmarchaeota archaeon]
MTAKDGLEIEVKFRIGDTKPYEEKLEKLGAKFIESGLERNIKYKGNGLEKTKDLLRLRTYGGKIVLTHKRKPKNHNPDFKVQEETDVIVDISENAKKILERLGYEKSWIYEKRRQIWILDGVEVLIDELPLIGNFIEIEGSEEEIKSTAKKLGFYMKDASTKNYGEEYKIWRKSMGLPKEDLIFRE